MSWMTQLIERYVSIAIVIGISLAGIGVLYWLFTASGTPTVAVTGDDTRPWPDISRPVDSQLLELPLTIAASAHVGLGEGDPWCLSVNSAGQAELVVWKGNDSKRTTFEISSEQLESFRRTLIDNHFFELHSRQHGRFIFDGHEATLAVTADNYTQIAQIRYIAHLRDLRGSRQFKEARAAVVAFSAIRTWFKHPSAIDPRGQWMFILEGESDDDQTTPLKQAMD